MVFFVLFEHDIFCKQVFGVFFGGQNG